MSSGLCNVPVQHFMHLVVPGQGISDLHGPVDVKVQPSHAKSIVYH